MPIEKNIITLLDALQTGYNNALPDPITNKRGPWQPVLDDAGHVLETFCNYFTSSVAQAFAYQKIFGKSANDIYDFVSAPANGWTKIDGTIAQSHANDGCLVIAAWKNPTGHGHVNVICPGVMQQSGSYGHAAPKCVNVGRDVFFGRRISFAFKIEPDYFVLGEMV